MDDKALSLEGHVPTLKELTRHFIISIPGDFILMFVILITVAYMAWSLIKAGRLMAEGTKMGPALRSGFRRSYVKDRKVSISRIIFVCTMLITALICMVRGLAGFLYVALPQ